MSDEETEKEFPTLIKWQRNRTQSEVVIPSDIIESLEADKTSRQAEKDA